MSWIRLDEAIFTDDWYMELSEPCKIAWLHFLLLAKRNRGRVGTCSPKLLSGNIFTTVNAAQEMLDSALKNGNLLLEDDKFWKVKNWSKYQEDQTNSDRQSKHRENVSNGEPRYSPLRNENNADGTYTRRNDTRRTAEQSARTRDHASPPPVSKPAPPPNPDLARQAKAAVAKFKPSENGTGPEPPAIDLAPLFEAYDAMREENSVLHPIDLTARQRDALAEAIAKTQIGPPGTERTLTVTDVIEQLRRSKFLMGKRAGNFGLHWLTKPANMLALMSGDWETDFDERDTKPEWVDPATQHEWDYRDGKLTKVPKRDHLGQCLLCGQTGDDCRCEP